MIQGEVKFVSDERTNILIIFSKQANFDFFDRIIKVLDVPVDPAVVVETIDLEYAQASEMAGILNDFVGAAKETEETKNTTPDAEGGSRSVADILKERAAPTAQLNDQSKSAIGRLSADTKIISDERTNSLILMGRKSDIEALKVVIASLDVMLQQVMIEAVILNIGLDDSIQTGIQWVYDSVPDSQELLLNTTTQSVPYTNNLGRVEYYDSKRNFYGPPRDLSRAGFDAADLAENMVGGALSYYGFFPDLNVKAIISAAKSDSDARILSTPVVLTTDNTEATITVADERPVITSSINSGSGTINNNYSARATYEYKTIGIDLKVTPHINPNNFVLMEITQSADDVGGNVTVDGNEVPIIQKREISATVGVKDKETVVLGGLVRKSSSDSATKIPLLGDIPLLGWLFSSHSKSDDRQELVVLLTPYVLNNPAEASAETTRRFNASDSKNTQWPRGWSLSELANDEPEADSWKKDADEKE
jgi:general secretion pathway protein D